MNEAPGPINFTMFLTMFGEKLNGTDPEDVIRNAFACFDEEGTGMYLYILYIGHIFETIVHDRYSYNYLKPAESQSDQICCFHLLRWNENSFAPQG